jgi:CO/xanthine dehydrogenase Mo-binding subunit
MPECRIGAQVPAGPQTSRREFLRLAAAGGIAVIVMPYPSFDVFGQTATGAVAIPSEDHGWMGPPGQARYRIDGLPKVTGAKIYARDFHARDLNGWPKQEAHALVLRVGHFNRTFTGVNLKILPPELQPYRTITNDDLVRDKIAGLWYDDPQPMFVPVGGSASLLGQPAAILFFDAAQKYREAVRLLQFHEDALLYGGDIVPVKVSEPFPRSAMFLTRFEDEFSQVKNGPSDPNLPGPVNELAHQFREKIRERMGSTGLKLYKQTYTTQVVDPMFLEPEAGLAWYDSASETLQLLLGTQSSDGDIASAGSQMGAIFHDSAFRVNKVVLHPCYPGGGFGGRDVSPFLALLAIAGAYAGRPVSIANDRFAQFQSGIKRNASTSEVTIAVNDQGKFAAIENHLILRGGGTRNYSPVVAQLAGFSAGNSYNFPVSSVDSKAQSTYGVTGGSMRGFGGPQAFFAVESLVDEIAGSMSLDPIELRLQNVLHEGDGTVTGYKLQGDVRLAEICKLARETQLWSGRNAQQAKRAGTNKLWGVGFALSMQAYGVGRDGVMAAVEIGADGEIGVITNCVDMGNGSATSLAISTANSLGANAGKIQMGEVPFFETNLPLESGGKSPRWNDPRWTASWAISSSACLTAFQQVHVVEQASRVIFLTGLWPAALALWGKNKGDLKPDASRWENGQLLAPNLPPLALKDIARRAFADGNIIGAAVHAVYQGKWIAADYEVDNEVYRWPLDAVATRAASSPTEEFAPTNRGQWPLDAHRLEFTPAAYEFHERFNTILPPPNSQNYGRSLYAPAGALVAVEVDKTTGRVDVLALELFLDAGRVIQPDLLSGQFEGGVAMGIGYALLEELPLETGGAGDGTWNLNRYHVALAGDMPLQHLKLNILPATSPDAKGKGIAETVMCPIAPAIANAITHAIGKRFRDLPITPEKIRQSLGS